VLNGVLNASGGYDYIISRVQEGIKIEIGPETVANESIASVAVWASENAINIETPERTRVDIYSIAGVLVKRMDIAGGITTINLPKGVYVVALPNIGLVQKAIVK